MRRTARALLLALGLGCRAEPPPPAPAPPAIEGVVVVCIDALRADRLTPARMPRLRALAADAVWFTDATSPAPWTLPSQLSVFTGRPPSAHGVTNRLRAGASGELEQSRLPEDIPTYAEHLRGAGWRTAGFTGGAGVAGAYGFARGFDVWQDDVAFGGLDRRVPEALAWLDDRPDGPFLLFVHGYDVHGQFALDGASRDRLRPAGVSHDGTPAAHEALREDALQRGSSAMAGVGAALPPGTADYLAALYDAKVTAADAQVGALVDGLAARGLTDRVVVVVYADHGEELFDHGGLDHGLTLFQEQVHVPLLVRWPGGPRGQRVDAPVSTLDLFPTVLARVGVAPPAAAPGHDLLTTLPGPVFAETDYRLLARRRMVRRGPHKLVLDLEAGTSALYDLAADPRERRDVAGTEPRVTYELEQLLRAHMASQERARPAANPFALPE